MEIILEFMCPWTRYTAMQAINDNTYNLGQCQRSVIHIYADTSSEICIVIGIEKGYLCL